MPYGIVALALLAPPLLAHASCNTVEVGFAAKRKVNGLTYCSSTVVPNDENSCEGNVAGQCHGDEQIDNTSGKRTAAADQVQGSSPHAPRTSKSPSVTACDKTVHPELAQVLHAAAQ